MLTEMLETAERRFGTKSLGVCLADLGDSAGRSFAEALHDDRRGRLDPAHFDATWWGGAMPLDELATVAVAAIGAEAGVPLMIAQLAGVVPVLVVANGVAFVLIVDPPGEAPSQGDV